MELFVVWIVKLVVATGCNKSYMASIRKLSLAGLIIGNDPEWPTGSANI